MGGPKLQFASFRHMKLSALYNNFLGPVSSNIVLVILIFDAGNLKKDLLVLDSCSPHVDRMCCTELYRYTFQRGDLV